MKNANVLRKNNTVKKNLAKQGKPYSRGKIPSKEFIVYHHGFRYWQFYFGKKERWN